MNSVPHIYTVPDDQRYWVARASGGDYLQHFLQDSIIAIGHLDELELSEADNQPFFPDLDEIEKSIERKLLLDKGKATITNIKHQVAAFVGGMQIGDLVVTVNSRFLVIGRITGHPYIEKRPVKVVYDKKHNRSTSMSHNLRRKVQWGPRLPRKTIPFRFEKTLRAHQTVFNIDKHWDLLHHLVYPYFNYGDEIYFTLNIKQKDEINSYSIGRLFNVLTDLEIFSKCNEKIIESPSILFEELFNYFQKDEFFGLMTKAEFASPGSIWGKIGLSDKEGKKLLYFVVGMLTLFGGGGKYIGMDGIITPKMRETFLEYLLNHKDKSKTGEVIEKLKLKLPNFETDKLESNEFDEPQDARAIALASKVSRT